MEPYIIVSCPYNPAHRIQKYKLMSHIAKCKKSANTANKVECPLDKSHIVDQEHLKEHIATCPSLGNLIDMSAGYNKKENDIIMDKHMSSENWDEEPEVQSYNPMEASASKQVIRCISGMSKAEKRKFRKNERMRVENLKAINPINTSSLSVKDTVQELPLRPPHDTFQTLQTAETQETQVYSDKSQINCDTSTQAEYNPEFQNLFFTTLYDKLDPECNDINQQLEQSLHGIDMETNVGNSQPTNRKEKNLPLFNQNHETEEVKQKLNETYEISDKFKKEKNECIGENRASSKTSERVTELLATIKGDIKKVEIVEEIGKANQNDKDLDERGLNWSDVLKKFNDRLVYLTDIQNTAAEESARLLRQLKELKLREEAPSKK